MREAPWICALLCMAALLYAAIDWARASDGEVELLQLDKDGLTAEVERLRRVVVKRDAHIEELRQENQGLQDTLAQRDKQITLLQSQRWEAYSAGMPDGQ
eukprot:gnl/MRDRNA2_/MRDRNA2_15060_c0_seq1.p1 gnl/MRDRNA2_/MRDRNA2_15060_c0~~gnl/MRDRNA2_/MRDRNA2_15060_c0_seq1.p1  ORF type:complete len:100 (+),score=19.73 gnl/MRDRNA2_/MRDRNA2_15060_c0_seq1:202-501(+)